jgi:hypothetical protein
MPATITIDNSGLIAGLDRMIERIFSGVEDGLQFGAAVAEEALQTTIAHGDMSGATRSSYRAFIIGGAFTGSAESASGYSDASQALANFTGHEGKPLSQDSGVQLTPNQRGVLLTSYTDYQTALETERGGQRATLGPTLQATADQMTEFAADGTKHRLQ